MERGFAEVFNWGFIASFTVASTAVVAIANTLRQWFKLEPRWAALAAAEGLSFYAASWADPSFTIWRFFMVLCFGALLCCDSVWMQGPVLVLIERFDSTA